ncbi:MAG: hypothetical protein AAFX02_06340 [Pseudomonadota bacterium]
MSLDLILTLTGLAAMIGLAVFANHKAAQPWDDMKPKKLPWKLIMVIAGFGAFLAVVHLVNLAGVETGPENSPFGRF